MWHPHCWIFSASWNGIFLGEFILKYTYIATVKSLISYENTIVYTNVLSFVHVYSNSSMDKKMFDYMSIMFPVQKLPLF